MSDNRRMFRLVVSYTLDWIVVITLAVGGGVLNYISGYHRPFSLTDTSLTYPEKNNIVSLTIVGIVAFAVPAVAIAVLCLALPARPLPGAASRPAAWRRKLWDMNAGLLGLAFSLALTLFVTSGLKNIIGKPRPDLLARCDPDVSNIDNWRVGGFGTSLDSEASALVVSGICRQPNQRLLDDGFAAFPSGHSSFSWAGLLYFTLWFCSKLSITIPHLGITTPVTKEMSGGAAEGPPALETQAAPPLWLVLIALFPCGVALFICSSRYADFHHAGFDIIAGSVIGILFAWGCFRTYHPRVRQGVRASWGPRQHDHAFFARTASENSQSKILPSLTPRRVAQDGEAVQSQFSTQRVDTGPIAEEMVTPVGHRYPARQEFV
ncbi:hypothetical protein LTR80_011383 [Exophiala xenobiotica]